MSEWNTYAEQVKSKFDYDSNDWAITNISSGAAIYGLEGGVWGLSEGMSELTTYQHELDDGEGNKEMVEVNEVTCAAGAADGNRAPSKAGIRICGKKYMLTYKDE